MAGCHTLAEGELYGSEKKKRETEANLRKARESASYLYSGKSTHRANRYLNREKEGDATTSASARDGQKGRIPGPHHLLSGGSSLLATSGGKGSRRAGVALDLAGFPGVELLSSTVSTHLNKLFYYCVSLGYFVFKFYEEQV